MEHTSLTSKGTPKTGYRVLLIEDDKVDQMSFKKMVEQNNLDYRYAIVASADEARRVLGTESFDIIITDYQLGDGTAFDVLNISDDTPIIITTGAGNEEIAVKAMREGAFDYLIKDIRSNYLKVLPITIENAIRRAKNQQQLRMLSHAMMSVGESVYITDMANKIIFVNKAFMEAYKYTEEEIMGKDCSVLRKDLHNNGSSPGVLGDNVGSRNESIQRRKDGGEFPALSSNSFVRDENGNKIAIVGVVRDISEIKDAQEKLRVYATTDILTGALNRRAGLLILEKQMHMSKRNNLIFTICYIDINSLKEVNDKYGHQEGDEYILIVTDILKEVVRESDTICRLGGDEFLIILPDCDIIQSDAVWNRIEQKLAAFNSQGKKAYEVSVSRGYAQFNPGMEITIEEMIAVADAEMYKDKKLRAELRAKSKSMEYISGY